MGAIVILQGGRRVETVKAPKCCPFPWCYKQTFTICVGVDAEWHFNALRQEQSRRRPDRPSEPFPRNWSQPVPTVSYKLLDVAEGLNYLHMSYTMHGDLKGVGARSES